MRTTRQPSSNTPRMVVHNTRTCIAPDVQSTTHCCQQLPVRSHTPDGVGVVLQWWWWDRSRTSGLLLHQREVWGWPIPPTSITGAERLPEAQGVEQPASHRPACLPTVQTRRAWGPYGLPAICCLP